MDETLIPPESLDYGIRVSQFRAIGEEYAGHCRALAGLRPDGHVLDVGCGFGPLGAALTSHLSLAGRYEGIDAVPVGVEWASRTITPRHPNFRFTWVDVYNQTYHRAGQLDPRSFRFPFPDDSFDLVYLRSVFTHMTPAEVSNYLNQIRRVLKPDGRALVSYFLLNAESRRLMDCKDAPRKFSHDYGSYWQDNPGPGGTVAYEESFVRELYARRGLAVVEPIYFGRWCGRPVGASSQDLVIAVKGALR